jgi:hypothetical protein
VRYICRWCTCEYRCDDLLTLCAGLEDDITICGCTKERMCLFVHAHLDVHVCACMYKAYVHAWFKIYASGCMRAHTTYLFPRVDFLCSADICAEGMIHVPERQGFFMLRYSRLITPMRRVLLAVLGNLSRNQARVPLAVQWPISENWYLLVDILHGMSWVGHCRGTCVLASCVRMCTEKVT